MVAPLSELEIDISIGSLTSRDTHTRWQACSDDVAHSSRCHSLLATDLTFFCSSSSSSSSSVTREKKRQHRRNVGSTQIRESGTLASGDPRPNSLVSRARARGCIASSSVSLSRIRSHASDLASLRLFPRDGTRADISCGNLERNLRRLSRLLSPSRTQVHRFSSDSAAINR